MVSIVIEGYNEAGELGTVADTMTALRQQDFPLDQINVLIVGTSSQVESWTRTYSGATPFASVRAIACDDGNYYTLKNVGAAASTDAIIAFIDSDVIPEREWISSIVETIDNGADVSVGLSKFKGSDQRGLKGVLIKAVSAIGWGWVVGRKSGGRYSPNGIIPHNIAVRAKTFQRHTFATDHGRTCSGMLFYQRAVEDGARFVLQPKQMGTHSFSLRGILTFNLMVGYEILTSRRLNPSMPVGWTSRTGVLSPLICAFIHSIFDVPQSLRYARTLNLGTTGQAALVVAAVPISVASRLLQAVGMYSAMLAPERMRHWAEGANC